MTWKFIRMLVLIQGPKQLGNNIDVYLRPFVEKLLLLCKEEDVRVWDKDKQESFDLRALLCVTMNDWPALNNLLEQAKQGILGMHPLFRCYSHHVSGALQQGLVYGNIVDFFLPTTH